ncbi:MAG: hypothetical protein Q8O64_12325 [Sideroxyarcus sp.]|nr:hypothetical protein [Sideroxyarcus sp.]
MSKAAIVANKGVARALLDYCPDIEDWPKRRSYEESDLATERRIVEFFKPFLLYLLTKKLAASTLRRHRDHLWMLGGEVIRRRQEDSHLCSLPAEKVTFALLEEDGGPLIWPRITEQEQDAFDASCRKFYRFLTTASERNSG